jgi:hypothetical protein
MPIKTIEEEIKEAEGLKAKLYEDINALEDRRSGLRNEISIAIDEAQRASELKHEKRMTELEKDYAAKNSAILAREKYLDDYMVRLDAQKLKQDSKEKEIVAKDKVISDAEGEFKKLKEAALKEIEDAKAQVDKRYNLAIEKEATISTKDKMIVDKETRLNSQEIEIQAAQDKLQVTLDAIEDEKNVNIKALQEITDKLAAIERENVVMRSILDGIEREKAELAKLSVYKDDIVKLQEEQAKLTAKQAETKRFSQQVEARDVAVTERETSAVEKEKYLIIKDREVAAKTEILRKLRAGENA